MAERYFKAWLLSRMKMLLAVILAQLLLAAPLRSQTPTPTPQPDCVLAIAGERVKSIPYTAGMLVVDAMAKAGVFDDYANTKSIYLIRCGRCEKLSIKRMRSDPTENRVLQPWDVVCSNPWGAR